MHFREHVLNSVVMSWAELMSAQLMRLNKIRKVVRSDIIHPARRSCVKYFGNCVAGL